MEKTKIYVQMNSAESQIETAYPLAEEAQLAPETAEQLEQKKHDILKNANAKQYHTLLPISVQQALKDAVSQYARSEHQKRIAINDVTERALRTHQNYFKGDA